MGGCCCCDSRRAQHTGTPVYYYCPQTLEEREPLSSSHGVGSALSGGLLVDTNLDTSSPDTYRAPPAPMPYDSDLGRPQTPPVPQESRIIKVDEAVEATDSQSTEETITEEIKEVDSKVQVAELEQPLKSTEPLPIVEEEDCPICLEDYDEENPRITTKCDHHFHLACILEWMERSDTCPVCDQETVFNIDNLND